MQDASSETQEVGETDTVEHAASMRRRRWSIQGRTVPGYPERPVPSVPTRRDDPPDDDKIVYWKLLVT